MFTVETTTNGHLTHSRHFHSDTLAGIHFDSLVSHYNRVDSPETDVTVHMVGPTGYVVDKHVFPAARLV